MTWRRHEGDSKYHAGSELAGSFASHCSGRWPLSDEEAGLVELAASPPHDDRCEVCQRREIEVRRVSLGLRELRDSAEVITLPHERFDLGGEA